MVGPNEYWLSDLKQYIEYAYISLDQKDHALKIMKNEDFIDNLSMSSSDSEYDPWEDNISSEDDDVNMSE